MLGGSFTTQARAGKTKKAPAPLSAAVAAPAKTVERSLTEAPATQKPAFQPRVVSGYIFAFAAAACYGSSPLLARQAFLNAPGVSTAASGCIAYAAALLVFSLALLKPGSWQDIKGMKRENMPWFLAAAVLVAISQALVYASLAIAPLMVVTPILQLSLVFRLFLSQLINRDHEVMNTAVFIGAITAVVGSMLVSITTHALMTLLDLPPPVAEFLGYRLAGH